MITYDELLVRAERGYAWLRDEGPKYGFDIERLNPDQLDLADGTECALGQTHEVGQGYWEAAERLALAGFPVATIDDAWWTDEDCPTMLWERQHGFILNDGDAAVLQRSVLWDQLTSAWREVIKRNRDASQGLLPQEIQKGQA